MQKYSRVSTSLFVETEKIKQAVTYERKLKTKEFSLGVKEHMLPMFPYPSTGQAIILSTIIMYE